MDGVDKDRQALTAIYQSTGGHGWTNAERWLSDSPLDDWQGVLTGRDGRVDVLELPNNGLIGSIPAQIAQLDRLRILNLADNDLSGSIPAALGSARNLHSLKLDGNRLSGRIPPEFGNLAALEYLNLDFNRISGSIPPQLGNLSRLHTMRIALNALSGQIPPQLGDMGSLKILDLKANNLRGALPGAIGNLSQLQELDLWSNRLSGQIPAQIANLSGLNSLSLGDNFLTGPIPPTLGNLSQLQELDLRANRLSGQIPAQIANPPGLREVNMRGNSLTGPIPAQFGRAMNLLSLKLDDNNLVGEIPAALGNLVDLHTLHLDGNNLSGAIPPALGKLENLHQLGLSGNRLSGTIHPALHRLHTLGTLRLGGGQRFEGCIPVHWARVEDTDVDQIRLPSCPFGLPGLDITPGRLDPEFEPGVSDYTFWIGEGVDVITIVPVTFDAAITYLDRQGQELVDVDSSRDGYQFLLTDAAGGIRVRATAGDGSAEFAYNITARRLFPYQIKVADTQHFSAPGNPDLKHNIPDLDVVIDGRTVRADFLSHFNRSGNTERWGYPTSEVLALEPNTLTQFYQRGVVDFHNVGAGWITERRLAWDYVGGGLGGSPDLGVEEEVTNPFPGRNLGRWGHKVSNFAIDGTETGFADFFERLGGVASFGLPKTDARVDSDRAGTLRLPEATAGFVRQYFQAGVLEYHPYDDAAPVKLSLLGDTVRNLLVPGFGGELGFAAAAPLARGSKYAVMAVGTPTGYMAGLPEVAAAGGRNLTILETDRFNLRLFEGGNGREYGENALNQAYLDTFVDQTTRYVWLLLETEILPRRVGSLRSLIEVRYIRPDGYVIDRLLLDNAYSLQQDTKQIYVSSRPSRTVTSGFIPGTYRVEAWHAGRVVASTSFEVLSVPVPESEDFSNLLQAVSWAGDLETREHREARLRLAHIYSVDPQLATTIAGWEWVRGGLTSRNLEAIQLLSNLAHRDPALAGKLVNQRWLADGISVAEWRILLGAQAFDLALAESVLGSVADEPNSFVWQIRAIDDLRRIERNSPQLLAELQGKPWFDDGISESEAALLAVLVDVSESDEITRGLLESPLLQTRRISTRYSDEIDLTVVSRRSTQLPDNLLDRLELGVRVIEKHVGLPWPATDVTVFNEPNLNSVREDPVGGYFKHEYVAVVGIDSRQTTLYHELGHFFFSSGRDVLWLQESGPEYLEHHARWKIGALSLEDWERGLEGRMESACYRYGANTVRDYLDAVAALEGGDLRGSTMWSCHYQIGHHLLFRLRELLGENQVGEVLNWVISSTAASGKGPSGEEILAWLRARSPGDQAAELDRLIASDYGPT